MNFDANRTLLNVEESTQIGIQQENITVFQKVHTSESSPPKPVQGYDMTEHILSIKQVEQLYDTSIEAGLSSQEAESRLEKFGLNQLKSPKPKPFILLYFSYFFGTFNILLGVCGLLCFVLQAFPVSYTVTNYYLAAVLFFVVFFNSLVSSIQESKTQSILKSFSSLISQRTMVLRGTNFSLLDSKFLVVGDIIKVKQGDKVPADIRIIQSQGCKVDNSSLTGEAEPLIRKSSTSTMNPLEADNLCFFGTLIVQGDCVGIVIRTGQNTVIGSITQLSNTTKHLKSPLTEETDRFVKLISVIAIVMGILFFCIGMGLNGNLVTNFTFFIGIFTSNIPQGLPATVTFMLTFAANRLVKKNVLVKDIEGLDTLGAVTLICSDKTGTMTLNKMTVVNIWQSNIMYSTKEKLGEQLYNIVNLDDPFILACALNSKVVMGRNGEVLGDATETAIYKFISKANYDYMAQYPLVFGIGFNSFNKYSISINRYKNKYCAFLKGAPERVLSMCSSHLTNGVKTDISSKFIDEFNSAYKLLANQGQRVLALAMHELHDKVAAEDQVPIDQYVFLGLIGLQDPPKPKVSRAIASCQTAGIRVFMVTGDHPLTAEAIARQVGLLIGNTKEQAAVKLGRPIESVGEDEYEAVVVHGDNMHALTNTEWNKILNKTQVVFSRTSPKQKLEIVARCQSKGHVVAVTGDGVNDAPALKKADLGISMNISGSDVSKEAAKMLLLDDDFSSIVEAIAQGRLVFANLKKAILYTMSHIMAEAWAFLAYIVFPIPALSSALLIIMIDLFIDSIPAICFVNEPEDSNLMSEAPRRVVKPSTLIVNAEDAMQLERIESFKIEDIDQPVKPWYHWLWTPIERGGARLIDFNLLFQAYVQVALIQMIGGTFAFFLVFYIGVNLEGVHYYLSPGELWGNQVFPVNSDGSYGTLARGFTIDAWNYLYPQACASYWLMIVVPQMFDLFTCKSMVNTVFTLNSFKNKSHFVAICWSMAVTNFLLYTPALMPVLQSNGPPAVVWVVGLVTGLVVLFVDTIRKQLLKMGYFGSVKTRPADVIDGISRVLTR
eukprot:NODE_568_length_6607_cov_0.144130.p1 type:complete len:1059 gc:universal NODE_568_length_6607_cov_0.144130:5335-2159(-)